MRIQNSARNDPGCLQAFHVFCQPSVYKRCLLHQYYWSESDQTDYWSTIYQISCFIKTKMFSNLLGFTKVLRFWRRCEVLFLGGEMGRDFVSNIGCDTFRLAWSGVFEISDVHVSRERAWPCRIVNNYLKPAARLLFDRKPYIEFPWFLDFRSPGSPYLFILLYKKTSQNRR